MDADRKKPTPVYEPFLKALVIDDLQDAERSGSFDRDVLLFAQDGYVMRAFSEFSTELGDAFSGINADTLDPDDRAQRKRDAVIAVVRELYERLKAEGDETTGVRGYAGAAGVYLRGAIVDFQTYLLDVAQHLERAVAVGHTPDLPWLAGHTYAALAKASSTMVLTEEALGLEPAQRAEDAIGEGVRAIGALGQDSVAMALGRQMWHLVEAIDRAPAVHVVNEEAPDLHDRLQVGGDSWDFDLAERQEFEP